MKSVTNKTKVVYIKSKWQKINRTAQKSIEPRANKSKLHKYKSNCLKINRSAKKQIKRLKNKSNQMQMNPTCTNRNRTSEKWIELQTGMKPLTHVTQMSKPHISNLHKNKSKGQRTGSIVSPEVLRRLSSYPVSHRQHCCYCCCEYVF